MHTRDKKEAVEVDELDDGDAWQWSEVLDADDSEELDADDFDELDYFADFPQVFACSTC